MYNDSLETLLARHYGHGAVAPAGLEQRVRASVQQQATRLAQEQKMVTPVVSRRRAVQLVALSSLGVGIVNLGLEALETALVGQEAAHNAAMP